MAAFPRPHLKLQLIASSHQQSFSGCCSHGSSAHLSLQNIAGARWQSFSSAIPRLHLKLQPIAGSHQQSFLWLLFPGLIRSCKPLQAPVSKAFGVAVPRPHPKLQTASRSHQQKPFALLLPELRASPRPHSSRYRLSFKVYASLYEISARTKLLGEAEPGTGIRIPRSTHAAPCSTTTQ